MSLRRQKDNSTDLDVFGAAHYFSGTNELIGSGFTAVPRQPFTWRTRRMSLDGSTTTRPEFSNRPLYPSKLQIEKQAKEKQPRSPGGRLASFLNSLFNQSSSRKKKSKKLSNNNNNNLNDVPASSEPAGKELLHEEEEQRRKRRSSISHFRFRTSAAAEDTSTVTTPTKAYKDFRSYSVAKSFIGAAGNAAFIRDDHDDDSFIMDVDNNNYYNGNNHEKVDGGDIESDSSSDLFELKNYDIGPGYGSGCGCDLPVYETTELERLNIGSTPISVHHCS